MFLDSKEFASGAEAVAYYYNRGFKSNKRLSLAQDGAREMVKENLVVVIEYVGFLTWKANEYLREEVA